MARPAHEFERGHVGSEPEPDAVARGWTSEQGERTEALFVLAGRALGVGRGEQHGGTLWLELDQLVNLDAIGDPEGGPPLQTVELRMEDGTTVLAGWPLPFCDSVVASLERIAGRGGSRDEPAEGAGAPDVQIEEVPADQLDPTHLDPTHLGTDRPGIGEPDTAAPGDLRAPGMFSADPPPSAPVQSVTAPADAVLDTARLDTARSETPATIPTATPDVPSGTNAEDREAPRRLNGRATHPSPPTPPPVTPAGRRPEGATVRPGTLELEDVVYLGGYPGHTKKRKKCTATLSREGFDVAGPNGLQFRLAWDVVRTIEVQNSDEARFRMNAKIHRDASALVIECDQGVTILLEARDCPTIALRAAIGQLMTDLPVVVV